MANIKVSELNTATQFNDEDYTMIVQNGENKKITKENAFNDINEEIVVKTQRHIISATINTNYTLTVTDSYEILPLNTSLIVGNKLSLNNNGIVVGSNVSKVKISAKLSFNSVASSGLKWLTINNGTGAVLANPVNLSARNMVYATDTLVEVNEGDLLTLQVNGNIGDIVRAGMAYTNITVEVVE